MRSRRKTVSISVHRDGTVTVHAPLRTSERVIRSFVEQKTPWIEEKLRQFSAQRDIFADQKGKIPYLGQWLAVRAGGACPVVTDAWELPAQNRVEALDKLLHTLARAYIVPRVKVLSEQYGFSYADIHITSAKTRFGSCSGKNNLNFTKYLVMYDPVCIDYVILHELCHTIHHDHSAAFYRELGRVCPAYCEIRDRMKNSPFLGDFATKMIEDKEREESL